jgi:hypothetical protein
MEPDQARWLDEYRTLGRLHPLWLKSAETHFLQRATLAANIPFAPLRERKGLAVVQTLVFAWLKPVFAQAGLRHPGAAGGLASREPGAKAIACRTTAELINSFTTYRTTPQAVSSEVGRQVERQGKGMALLEREGTADKVSKQGPNLPPPNR